MKSIKESIVRKRLSKKSKSIKIEEYSIEKDASSDDLDLNVFIKNEDEIPTEVDLSNLKQNLEM